MNKQELIDKAVHALGGKWPSVFNMPTKRTAIDGFYITNCGTITHKDHCEWFKECEFQQRAKELGYINGYRWSVEYPTNGEKPDLLDDISVQVRNDIYPFWTCGQVGGLSWSNVFNFRITDERYKPADTSYLVSEIPESKSNAENVSDWYDYEAQKPKHDKLPPVGAKCQVLIDEVFVDCTVIHHANNSVRDVAAFKASQFEYCDVGRLGWSVDFRPLDYNRKAEAEKKRVVDAAFASLSEFNKAHQVLGELYDAGFLRMPAE